MKNDEIAYSLLCTEELITFLKTANRPIFIGSEVLDTYVQVSKRETLRLLKRADEERVFVVVTSDEVMIDRPADKTKRFYRYAQESGWASNFRNAQYDYWAKGGTGAYLHDATLSILEGGW